MESKKKETREESFAESLVRIVKDGSLFKMSPEVEAMFIRRRASDEASKLEGFTLGHRPKISAGLA